MDQPTDSSDSVDVMETKLNDKFTDQLSEDIQKSSEADHLSVQQFEPKALDLSNIFNENPVGASSELETDPVGVSSHSEAIPEVSKIAGNDHVVGLEQINAVNQTEPSHIKTETPIESDAIPAEIPNQVKEPSKIETEALIQSDSVPTDVRFRQIKMDHTDISRQLEENPLLAEYMASTQSMRTRHSAPGRLWKIDQSDSEDSYTESEGASDSDDRPRSIRDEINMRFRSKSDASSQCDSLGHFGRDMPTSPVSQSSPFSLALSSARSASTQTAVSPSPSTVGSSVGPRKRVVTKRRIHFDRQKELLGVTPKLVDISSASDVSFNAPTSPISVDLSPSHSQSFSQLAPRRTLARDSCGGLASFVISEIILPGVKRNLPETPSQRVSNFFGIPYRLEQLMFFGLCICFENFLDVLVFCPFRLFVGLLSIIWGLFRYRWRPTPELIASFLRLALVVICFQMLNSVDISLMYHYIRAQSTFKLYVLYGMLQIFETLCSSFGLDVVDNMMAHIPMASWRLLLDFILSACYTILHSFVLFAQVVTLNAAINSKGDTLLGVLVFNNMAELKGFVFKRYSKLNLHKVTCQDIRERFQLVIFLIMIFIQNLTNLRWKFDQGWFTHAATISALFCIIEYLLDWIKHGFITKFNHIRPIVYSEYSEMLCADIVSRRIRKNKQLMRNSFDAPTRIGFSVLPYVCLLVRICYQAFDASDARLASRLGVAFVVGACLLVTKVALSIGLFGHSCKKLMLNFVNKNVKNKLT
eukprot:296575_1